MLPGISTACLYPELTEKALKQLAKRGVAAVEIFFNAPSELEESYIRELAQMARDGGIRIVSIHPFTSGFEPMLLFSSYRRRTLDGLECYKRYFHAANLLGADYIIIHGDHRDHNRSRAFYFHAFGELIHPAVRGAKEEKGGGKGGVIRLGKLVGSGIRYFLHRRNPGNREKRGTIGEGKGDGVGIPLKRPAQGVDREQGNHLQRRGIQTHCPAGAGRPKPARCPKRTLPL